MLIDSHCHLYLSKLADDIPGALARAAATGVERVVCPATDLETSRTCAELAAEHPAVFAAAGVHPNHIRDLPADYGSTLRALLAAPKMMAVGEIGLDYYRDYSPPATQQRVFAEQLELAQDLDLPVIVHNRDADADVLEILRASGWRQGVAHCFSGDLPTAQAFIDLGFYISFAGNFTYKHSHLPAVARALPPERLLVETDAPFLSPVPFRGKTNEPARVRFTALALAAALEKELDEIAALTRRNAERLFRLPGAD